MENIRSSKIWNNCNYQLPFISFDHYFQNQFLKRLLILFVHLFFLSISVYTRPTTENLSNKLEEESRTDRAPAGDPDHTGSLPTSSSEGIADDSFGDDMDVKNIIRYCSEVATLMGVLSYVIFQQGDEIKNQGLAAFTKQLVTAWRVMRYCQMILINSEFQQVHAPAKAIFLVSNILILACIPFRMIGDTDTEEAILVFAVPGSWFLLMFFAG